MRLIAFLFLVASSVARAEVAKLTESNYADRTAGRTVFVKVRAHLVVSVERVSKLEWVEL